MEITKELLSDNLREAVQRRIEIQWYFGGRQILGRWMCNRGPFWPWDPAEQRGQGGVYLTM